LTKILFNCIIEEVGINLALLDYRRFLKMPKGKQTVGKEEGLTTNVILTAEIWENAKIRAAKERITLSELTRRALRKYLGMKNPAEKGGRPGGRGPGRA
jgi:hypothetical protein